METSTSEFWDVDGVPLSTYCWAIKSFGGSRKGLPPLRGDNKVLPNREGRSFRPKKADSRVITLAMWITGSDPDTGMPSSHSQIVQWNDNWDYLSRLFWTPDREVTLTRREWTNAADPRLVEASAKAQIAGTMEPSMTGRTRADFAVDLLLSDPFFYGDEIEKSIAANSTVAVYNPGDSKTGNMPFSIEWVGSLTNPKLTNLTNGSWMQINTLISLDTDIHTDIKTYRAVRSTDLVSMNAAITHGGSRQWISLEPGANQLRLDASGSGAVILKFNPAYV